MRITTRSFLVLRLLFAAFALGSATAGWAQVTTATLYGIVRDPTGAVIPGAEVTLTHESTSGARQTTTGDTGEFVFTTLPVGAYTLRIVKPGFKSHVSSGIELAAAQNVRQAFNLEVGEVAEKVTVEGGALLPYHNALDLTRVWKNSELVGTLGTSHHSILDDPAAIRATLSFFRAIKLQSLVQL